jgi:hypothetical protein
MTTLPMAFCIPLLTDLNIIKWLSLHLSREMFEGTRLISEANMQVVLSPKTVIEPQLPSPLAHTTLGSTKAFYCEGWVYSAAHPYPVIWHNGDTGGIHAVVGFIPAAQLGLVVLTDLGGTQLPEALLWYLNDLYFSNPRTDWSQVLLAMQQAEPATARTALGEPPTTGAADCDRAMNVIGGPTLSPTPLNSENRALLSSCLTLGEG